MCFLDSTLGSPGWFVSASARGQAKSWKGSTRTRRAGQTRGREADGGGTDTGGNDTLRGEGRRESWWGVAHLIVCTLCACDRHYISSSLFVCETRNSRTHAGLIRQDVVLINVGMLTGCSRMRERCGPHANLFTAAVVGTFEAYHSN